jgi:hypothetical protein
MQRLPAIIPTREESTIQGMQYNLKYHDRLGPYTRYPEAHKRHFTKVHFGSGKPKLCCHRHPQTWLSKPVELESTPESESRVSGTQMTPTELHQYLIAENQALKVDLASVRCLITEIITEIQKTTPAQQPNIQVPDTASGQWSKRRNGRL